MKLLWRFDISNFFLQSVTNWISQLYIIMLSFPFAELKSKVSRLAVDFDQKSKIICSRDNFRNVSFLKWSPMKLSMVPITEIRSYFNLSISVNWMWAAMDRAFTKTLWTQIRIRQWPQILYVHLSSFEKSTSELQHSLQRLQSRILLLGIRSHIWSGGRSRSFASYKNWKLTTGTSVCKSTRQHHQRNCVCRVW